MGRAYSKNGEKEECMNVQGVAIKNPDYFYDSFPATSLTKRRVGH